MQKFAMQEISQIQEIDTFYLDFNKVCNVVINHLCNFQVLNYRIRLYYNE